jgi:RIO-like serine/threonine protein kinase
MEKLHGEGFKTPVPMAWNRHCIVMSLVEGYTLQSVTKLGTVEIVFN